MKRFSVLCLVITGVFGGLILPAKTSAQTLPPIETVLEEESATDGPKLKILPPERETPIGILRLVVEVEPPIVKVAFWLGDKLILTRTRPPYTAEIDLGDVPRKQTIRVVGYDAGGTLIDQDALAINQGNARIVLTLLPEPDTTTGTVRVKIAVQSIRGGSVKSLELFLDNKKIKRWDSSSPSYEAMIPLAEYSKASYLRATAIAEDGQEANDIRSLKGGSSAMENVRVDVVQLHIAAFDKAKHFAKGLSENDFAIEEDGRPQKITGFEVAENLPIAVGLVVDGSGSMEKSMPFVHNAGSELFKALIREKDQGFVIEFREQPRLVQDLTASSSALQRAAREPNAQGGTALYDSIILGLYQFRTLQGRKALVVVTDGADNRSHADYATLLRYARSAGAPIYFIAVGIPITNFPVRKELNEIARESGGEVFHLGSAEKISDITKRIEEELRSQYIAAFHTDSQKPDGEYRAIKVTIAKPGMTARTIKGYIP
ncbi:MAG: VWA domain-containing protein [bacterium]|nr:VWA domain-containing protein [bacterium]